MRACGVGVVFDLYVDHIQDVFTSPAILASQPKVSLNFFNFRTSWLNELTNSSSNYTISFKTEMFIDTVDHNWEAL
jgi:hypothetical protein